MRVTVRVPATSANLGPGFDTFGLALDLCNEVTVDTDAAPGVWWEGEGADELPTDGTDMVSATMTSIAATMETALPPAAIRGINRIPIRRGLGSSSAAAVAGVVVASRILDLGIDGWNVEPARRDVFSVFGTSGQRRTGGIRRPDDRRRRVRAEARHASRPPPRRARRVRFAADLRGSGCLA
jgi:hypothetical protein